MKILRGEGLPEVEFHESGEGGVPSWGCEIQPCRCFSIISLENVNSVLLRPQVNHFSSCVVEWVSKDTGEVSGDTGAGPDSWPLGGVGDSEENGGLVLEPVE